MTERLTVFRHAIDVRDGGEEIVGKAEGASACVEREILYPYYGFDASCSMPTMFGVQEWSLRVLVDGINGTAATADEYATESLIGPAAVVLEPTICRGEAERIATRSIAHQVRRKIRIIATVDVSLELTGVVHRRFSIVRVAGGRVLADGVTGALHPLVTRAA